MKLTFEVPSLDQVLETTLWTQEEGVAPFWRDKLYQEYPQLDQKKALALSESARKAYVRDILSQLYLDLKDELKKKAEIWQKTWQQKLPQIERALSVAYETEIVDLLNEMRAYPNLNPVCPRYLDSKTFYIFYNIDNDRAIRTCLHEIMHFLWFYKWQEYFHDDSAEYDVPHLKWIFSEMVQDTMTQNTPLKSLFDGKTNAYDYFYNMMIEEHPILETLAHFYRNGGLRGLFEDGYAYCKNHESELRAKIKQAESEK